jgi:ribosomal protein S18 acetylase RimI-like enzyme
MTPRNKLLLVRNLYESAFPSDERREFEALLDIVDTKPAFHAEVYEKEAKPAGFIFYWTFRDFVYVEHFAVAEAFRNQGYGKSYLLELCTKIALPVVLEVEKPENELHRRRIRFYENIGFKVSEMPYLQPAYSPDKKDVPMLLMYRGDICVEKAVEEIKKEVYNQ